MAKKKKVTKRRAKTKRRNPPDGLLTLAKARKWLREAVGAYQDGSDRAYLSRLIAATRPQDRDKLKAEATHLFHSPPVRSNPGLAVIHAGLIVNPPEPESQLWYLAAPGLGGAGQIIAGPVRAASAASATKKFAVAIRNQKAFARKIGQKLRPGDISVVTETDATILQMHRRRKNPSSCPTRRSKKLGHQTGGEKGEIPLDEYIAEYGMTAELEKAIKAYKKFHAAEPKTIKVLQYDDGKKENYEKVGIIVGQAPETHYVLPHGQESNKNGSHWVHHHKKGKLPYLFMDPSTGMLMTVGGAFRTTSWLYD